MLKTATTQRSASPVEQLFGRRLLVVVGKGGVGKTTVSCALALEAARLGRRVLLCEVDGVARAAHLLQVPPVPLGEHVEARPGVFLMTVEGKAALAEYLQLIIPVRRFLKTVFNSKIYQYFVAAAPGLKELMTMGKIWYEAERTDESTGKRLWDLVIMDAPATGHGLQYLQMPAAARDTFTSGLVHREAQRIVDLLTDPARTAISLVATAEEMPVNETITMYEQLVNKLGIPTGFLFVNRLHQSDFRRADIEKLREAAAASRDRRAKIALGEVADRADEEAGWTRLNERYLARLAEEIPLPLVPIPYYFTEEFGWNEVKQIAGCLADVQTARGRRRGRA